MLPRTMSGLRCGGGVGGLVAFARPSLAQLEGLTAEVLAVQTGDDGFGLVRVGELGEAEAPRNAIRPLDDLERRRRSERSEQVFQLRIGDVLGQISDVQFHGCSL